MSGEDHKIDEGVGYFEQMLKVMPDDRTALEFLTLAYEKTGERAKYERTLVSLARVLLRDGDDESVAALLPRLEACEDPVAKVTALRVKASQESAAGLVAEERREEAPVSVPVAAGEVMAEAVASESVLVEALVQEQVFPEETGRAVIEHLKGLPTDGDGFFVSALAVLERDNPALAERAMAILADRFRTPPVPLEVFEADAATAKRLPPAVLTVRGTIPFGKVGDRRLVATASVHDAALKSRVAEWLGERCVFFLAAPAAVEAAVAKLTGVGKAVN